MKHQDARGIVELITGIAHVGRAGSWTIQNTRDLETLQLNLITALTAATEPGPINKAASKGTKTADGITFHHGEKATLYSAAGLMYCGVVDSHLLCTAGAAFIPVAELYASKPTTPIRSDSIDPDMIPDKKTTKDGCWLAYGQSPTLYQVHTNTETGVAEVIENRGIVNMFGVFEVNMGGGIAHKTIRDLFINSDNAAAAADSLNKVAGVGKYDKNKTADGYEITGHTVKDDVRLWDINGVTGEVLEVIGRKNEAGTFYGHYMREARLPRVHLDLRYMYVRYENALKAALKQFEDARKELD